MFRSKQEDPAIAGLLGKFDDQQEQLVQLRRQRDSMVKQLADIVGTTGRLIANLETKLNLLMGFLKIEEYEIPEVPPTPGIPARVDMRKVK